MALCSDVRAGKWIGGLLIRQRLWILIVLQLLGGVAALVKACLTLSQVAEVDEIPENSAVT